MKLFIWNYNNGEDDLVVLHTDVESARGLVRQMVADRKYAENYFRFLDDDPVIQESPSVWTCRPTNYGSGAVLEKGI